MASNSCNMHSPWIIVALAALGISINISCTTASQTTNNNNNSSNMSSSSSALPMLLTATDLDNRDMERLWAVALHSINEAELQRRSPPSPPAEAAPPPQRINSKRLKWRPNSKLLNARALPAKEQGEQGEQVDEELLDPVEARDNTYTWTQAEDINPAYVDVRDHTPRPPTWWF